MSAMIEGARLFNTWATAYRAQQRGYDSAQWERLDRAEQTAWDTLIDSVEASHTPETCPCLACQAWRADDVSTLL